MDRVHGFNPLSTLDSKSAADLFEKDLSFFQLLLVLIDKSCPIRSVDLMWKSSESIGADLVSIAGTAKALQGACSRFVCSDRVNLSPKFCEIVHTGCSTSDKAAEARVSVTGKPEVYRCHAGLIDIAVPVVCDGQHIATLFTGQVLRSAPNASGFREVLRDVKNLGPIDSVQLKAAYKQVPVVTDEDIQHAVDILQIFADYLGTAWKRLLDATEAQQLRLRESQLLRKDMAQILLGGHVQDTGRLREIARTLRFSAYPNQILIVQPQGEAEPGLKSSSFDLEFTRVLYAIEDLTTTMKNVMAVHLHRRGICIFLANSDTLSEIKVYTLAQKILNCIQRQYKLHIRIGIGRTRDEWQKLGESYQEAWAALAESEANIAVYKDPPAAFRALSTQLTIACQSLTRRDLQQVHSASQSVLVLANRHFGHHGDSLQALRQFLVSALDALMLSAQALTCDETAVESLRREACANLEMAKSYFELQECWVTCVERLLDSVKCLYTGKHEKIVVRARTLIHKNIDQLEGAVPVLITEVSGVLGVSEGHLSRTFKRITGVTFERYVIEKRIERAQRLLLDPSSRVAEVAEKCGFCNPAYFARAFRKIVGCSPTDFSKHPSRYELSQLALSVTHG
jgi:AraC-like DNA-binding protein/ligand-binding sensor protein